MPASLRLRALTAALSIGAVFSSNVHAQEGAQPADGHGALVALFEEFRKFVPPQMRDGVPDYSPAAMSDQLVELDSFKRRLAAIDDARWPAFFISGTRAEGWAFYLEEFIQQAGFLDSRPKAREINYILQTKRAARVLPELKLHDNSWTYDEALASLTSRTPYWMGPNDPIARFDLELYLRQPGYGIGYYIGKVQLEALLADRARQLGGEFDLKRFHDEFIAAGVLPISLIRWEMTGLDDQIGRMRGSVSPPVSLDAR